MGNPVQPAPQSAPGAPVGQPDRLTQVRTLLNKKILALSQVVMATNTSDDLAEQAEDEINLCQAWVDSLDAVDEATLPSPAQDQNLLNAVQAVQNAVNNSAALNTLIATTAALINAFKAPG